jgi:hypothetical protein
MKWCVFEVGIHFYSDELRLQILFGTSSGDVTGNLEVYQFGRWTGHSARMGEMRMHTIF